MTTLFRKSKKFSQVIQYFASMMVRKWPYKPTLRLPDWDHGPVAYAQRALTTTEQHWFQIKKKLLTVMFSTEHFHHYIWRREAEVENDHKPLKMIIRKLSQNVSPRIQFMLLMLLRYKLNLKYAQALRYALLTCYCMHTCCYPQQRKQPRWRNGAKNSKFVCWFSYFRKTSWLF